MLQSKDTSLGTKYGQYMIAYTNSHNLNYFQKLKLKMDIFTS